MCSYPGKQKRNSLCLIGVAKLRREMAAEAGCVPAARTTCSPRSWSSTTATGRATSSPWSAWCTGRSRWRLARSPPGRRQRLRACRRAALPPRLNVRRRGRPFAWMARSTMWSRVDQARLRKVVDASLRIRDDQLADAGLRCSSSTTVTETPRRGSARLADRLAARRSCSSRSRYSRCAARRCLPVGRRW